LCLRPLPSTCSPYTPLFRSGVTVLAVRDGVVRMLWVNDVFTRVTGYAAHEVVGLEPRLFYSDQWSEVGVASLADEVRAGRAASIDRKSTRLNSSHVKNSYAA